MKKLFLLILILPLLAFTWEGELDPNDFDNWDLIKVIPESEGETAWAILENPDKTHIIDRIAILFDLNANLLGYRYFQGGEPQGYFFDIDEEKYVKHNYTPEQGKACAQCHADKLIRRTSI